MFDDDLTTFFDSPTADGSWVGVDSGSAKVATQLRFSPRAGFAARMVGGRIQASASATFSAGLVTLFTITKTPPAGSLITASLNNATAYRYYRYIGPTGSYCNISDLEFDM